MPNKRRGWKWLSLPTAPRLRRSRVRAWVQFAVRFVMKFLSQLAPCFWPWVEGLEYKILYETFGFSTFSTLRRYGRVGFEFARGMGEEEGCKKWENRFMKLKKREILWCLFLHRTSKNIFFYLWSHLFTWDTPFCFSALFDASQDSDIPKNVSFTFVINSQTPLLLDNRMLSCTYCWFRLGYISGLGETLLCMCMCLQLQSCAVTSRTTSSPSIVSSLSLV